MNKAEITEMLMADPTMTRQLAETMVTDWARMGMRHHNGKPVTLDSIRKIARPSRLWLKAHRNGRRTTAHRVMAAKRPVGIA
jgi:hypothetical protein